jgi:hypothetical protein
MTTTENDLGDGALCDDSAQFRDSYDESFEFRRANGFTTQTLPFAGGRELSVKR